MGKPSKGTPADMRLKENQGKAKAKGRGKAKGLGNTAFGPLNRQPMPKGAPVRPLKSAGG